MTDFDENPTTRKGPRTGVVDVRELADLVMHEVLGLGEPGRYVDQQGNMASVIIRSDPPGSSHRQVGVFPVQSIGGSRAALIQVMLVDPSIAHKGARGTTGGTFAYLRSKITEGADPVIKTLMKYTGATALANVEVTVPLDVDIAAQVAAEMIYTSLVHELTHARDDLIAIEAARMEKLPAPEEKAVIESKMRRYYNLPEEIAAHMGQIVATMTDRPQHFARAVQHMKWTDAEGNPVYKARRSFGDSLLYAVFAVNEDAMPVFDRFTPKARKRYLRIITDTARAIGMDAEWYRALPPP